MSFKGEHLRAGSPEEALAMLRDGQGRGCFIAGGTSLSLDGNTDLDFVVDISGAGLDEVAVSPQGDLFIGATTPVAALAASDPVGDFASGLIATAAARRRDEYPRGGATVGGLLCRTRPSAGIASALLALDAVAYLTDGESDESLMLHDFFVGPGRTVLDGRLLVGLALPAANRNGSTAAAGISGPDGDVFPERVAVALHLSGDTIERARIALGAAAPIPMLVEEAEPILEGVPLDDAAQPIEDAALIASLVCEPVDDARIPVSDRREAVRILVRRALMEAAGRGGAPA